MIRSFDDFFNETVTVNIRFIEPYDGGSHRAFRLGLSASSRHDIRSETLPARFWKWRMRGSAVLFADALNEDADRPDLLFCTDFLNVADFRGLLRPPLDRCPVVLYMHENQLTYPLSPRETFDFHFGFTNIVSCMAADAVVFNSDFHRDLFLDGLPGYLGRMPEAVPPRVRERLEGKMSVLPVGIDRGPRPADAPWGDGAPYLGGPCAADAGPDWPRAEAAPTILWNHRWEFDKRPEWLVEALTTLHGEGLDFRLHLLGETRQRDDVFAPLRELLGPKVLSFGHVPGRDAYDRILETSDIVVSCAAQEYFGISVAEAVQAGCYPVLPREQVYPSLYGTKCRGNHFYDGADGLADLLRSLVSGRDGGHVCSLPLDCDAFRWERLAPRFDDLFDELLDKAGDHVPNL